jgi:subtilisin family serine protease
MRACERPLLSIFCSLARPQAIVPIALATALGALLAADPALAGFRGLGGGHFGGSSLSGVGARPIMPSSPATGLRGFSGRPVTTMGDHSRSLGGKVTARSIPGGGNITDQRTPGGRIGDRRPPKGEDHDRRPPHHPRGPVKPGGGVLVGVPGGPAGGDVPPSYRGQPPQPPTGPANQALRQPGGGVPPSRERRYVPDEVVVELAGITSAGSIESLARRHRLARLESLNLRLTGTTIYRWRIPDQRSVSAVVRALEAEANVLSAQPNYIATLQQETPRASATGLGDPAQYALAKLQLLQAHALATGDNIRIAVIDSGIDGSHPELAGMIEDSFDAIVVGDKVHPHGTAIAGAIVAHARLMGIAPAARILAVRAFAPQRGTSESTSFAILKGLDWASEHGARIINISFAGSRDPAMGRALAAARAKGIVLIAAAGNAGPKSPPLYPAADPSVIAVTATDEDDKLFQAANRGTHIAVAAPGVDLLLPLPGSAYQITTGTSFAAAEVSGAVALLLERKPDLDPEAVRRILMSTARDLGPKGFDTQFGAGLVDVYAAVRSLAPDTVGQGPGAVVTGR